MDLQQVSQLILSVATLITAIGGAVAAVRASRKASIAIEKVEEVHKATNSMKDELVAATQKAGEAKGRDDEREKLLGTS